MSRLCRLRNASHGNDGQWAYSEIVGLREQVEKLTKERDAAWSVNPSKSEQVLLEKIAALAEQNEKLRTLVRMYRKETPLGSQPHMIAGEADEALQLPDLASPVLVRIRAEGMREAAKIANEHEQM